MKKRLLEIIINGLIILLIAKISMGLAILAATGVIAVMMIPDDPDQERGSQNIKTRKKKIVNLLSSFLGDFYE